MKLNLFIIIFIVSGCASSSIKFVSKGEYNSSPTHKQSRISHSESTENNTEVVVAEPETELFDDTVASKKTVTDRIIERAEVFKTKSVEESEVISNMKMVQHTIANVDELNGKLSNSLNTGKKVGLGFFVMAALLAVLSLIFVTKSTQEPQDTDTAEGCISSTFEMIAWMILGIIFGVSAAILLIIGLVVVISSRKNKV